MNREQFISYVSRWPNLQLTEVIMTDKNHGFDLYVREGNKNSGANLFLSHHSTRNDAAQQLAKYQGWLKKINKGL